MAPTESPAWLPPSFSSAGEAALPGQWWVLFEDPALDGLIERAMQQNLTLEAAWYRLEQARATARREGALLWPNAEARASLEHTFAPPPLDGSSFSLAFAASYELDLWGRVRHGRDAVVLEALAFEEEIAATAISLSAEIASTWYRLVERRGQMALLESQQAINESVLGLVELRFRLGRVGAQDVLRQRQLVEANRSEGLLLQAEVEVESHRLAVLLGEPPGASLPEPPAELVSAPALPATGLPVDLVRRRPDVRAALRRVEAADERVAAAVADRFPRLSLSASVSTSADEVRTLFVDWLGNLAANLTAPLFDGGRRVAEVERNEAVAGEALSGYGQSVLLALEEVESALSRNRYQGQFVESLEAQLALAGEALARARDSYERGAVPFVTVLDTLLSYQSLERSALSARRDLLQFRIDLCRALGGEWQLERPHAVGREEEPP